MKFSFLSKTPGEIQLLIAERVAEIRRRRGLSPQTLSRKSGVSLEAVQRFEQSGEITLLSLIKIATALNMNDELEHLFEDVPPLSIEEEQARAIASEIRECVYDMLSEYMTAV
ncbi:MAG: helix-turn-helix domain-containing protein [Lachnospiraceae bacterium]|nr:helix-turn-helix domain-containing protein [Lachnospiraceae bacterium]